MRLDIVIGVRKKNTLLIVNNSKSLKLNFLVLTVKIAELTILLRVV